MIFDLLLSLGLLCAMGALGVGLLTRPTPFLDPLERLSYGAALGVVVGSLGLLALGSLFGLSSWPMIWLCWKKLNGTSPNWKTACTPC